MKLNLLFIVMELFTILAYPIVFVYGKLRLDAPSRESLSAPKLFVAVPVIQDK